MDRPSLAGRTALVSGGSRGIGRAVVEALLAQGAEVVFCSRRESSVRQAEEELLATWPGIAGRACDVRRQEEVDALAAWALERLGHLDVLVNNAGLAEFGAVDELSGEAFRRVVETNLMGPFYLMRAVAPAMRERGSGWIFNVASLAGRNAFAGGAAYNASKFGLVGMSEAAMLDLRQDGVRVTTILPGSVDTAFHGDRRPERDWMLAPEDVARSVTDLLAYPDRALPSLVELRPSRPPKK